MRKSRFTEPQIVWILRQHDAGTTFVELGRDMVRGRISGKARAQSTVIIDSRPGALRFECIVVRANTSEIIRIASP